MKVNRINVLIKRAESSNDRIELHSMPENLIEKLNELKIRFWRMKK